MGDEMERAMQQAPHPTRQFTGRSNAEWKMENGKW
jgi:hypothetical protein